MVTIWIDQYGRFLDALDYIMLHQELGFPAGQKMAQYYLGYLKPNAPLPVIIPEKEQHDPEASA